MGQIPHNLAVGTRTLLMRLPYHEWRRIATLGCCFFLLISVTNSSDSSLNCDDHGIQCIRGECQNDTETGNVICVCEQGWAGSACQHCFGRSNMSASSGIITDGYGNYSIDTKCTWLIQAEPNSSIRLRFHHFATECSWDHVYIYDGNSVWDPLLAVLSGLVIPEKRINQTIPEITARSGSAYVHFYSDAAYNMSGFNLTYVVGSCPLDCSGRGECQENGECKCEPRWSGEGCDVPMCLNNCNVPWGTCTGSADSMYCDCSEAYQMRGIDCSIPDTKGVWMEVQQMPSDNVPHARASHASVIHEDDGNHFMYVVSGYDFDNDGFQNLIRYDFDSGFWSEGFVRSSVSPIQRYGHAVAEHQDKIYMFGGIVDTTISDELWVFDIKLKEWSEIVEISIAPGSEKDERIAVVGHSAHIVNGIMYIIFGHSPIYGYLNYVQKYYVELNQWQVINGGGALVKGGYGHSSVYEPNSNRIFVHAGYYSTSSSAYSLADTLYAFDVSSESWEILANSGQFKYLHSAVIMGGLMLVFGGNTHNDTLHSQGAKCYSTDFMAYDLDCNEWYTLDAPALSRNIARFGHSAEVYDNKMYVFGGFNGLVLNDMFEYQPGICPSHLDKESCLASREGVKCVWANDDKCLSAVDADDKYAHKNIQKIIPDTCQSRDLDTTAACSRFSSCPSCVSNALQCVWCGSRCTVISDCDGREKANSEEECLRNFMVNSKSCSNLHNCYACYQDPGCYWKSNENSCAVASADHLENDGVAEKECPPPCYTHQSCENCTEASCMWCSSQNQCVESNSYVPSFPYGQCMEWTTLHAKCPVTRCSELRSCIDCQQNPACGWCDDGSDTGLGTCMDGSLYGPINGTHTDPGSCPSSRWYFVQCPLCQCNGHSQCIAGTDICADCQNLTTGPQCQYCKDGYWGVATSGGRCQACECNGQADTCDRDKGSCFCRTRGVIGEKCDECDETHKYYGDPKNGGTCYYELTTDYQFKFNLSKEGNKYFTRINFMNTPESEDRDVDFNINCSGKAFLNITIKQNNEPEEKLLYSTECTYLKYKFLHNEYKFGEKYNTTFYVYIYDFKTPFRLQVAFSQYTQIDLVHFFITFFSCFLSLLLIAAIFWKVKQKYDLYRRRQRLVVEMEQMASRPFATCNLEIDEAGPEASLFKKEPPDLRSSARWRKPGQNPHIQPSPVALEPLARQKAAVLTLVLRLPTGDDEFAPPGQTGIIMGSALVSLGNPRKSSTEHQKSDKSSKRKPSSSADPNCV